MPAPARVWSEHLIPREDPLPFFEMSCLRPHFLREGRGKLGMYFTRVYNPVWTNPDGMSWIEMLTDEAKVERHACLTPIWSETAWFADFVLPMGHASERHDLMSQETHAARWIGFRQPVLRVMLERQGRTFDFTGRARRRPRGSGHARGRQGRPGGRPRGGRRGTARLSDAVPEARVLLADAQGVEVARGGRAELHPEPRALVGDRSRAGRDGAPADLPAPDAHPHALGQFEMAVRDLAHEPAVAPSGGCGAARRHDGRSPQGHDGHRSFRRSRLGDGGDPPRRDRVLAPPGALAASSRRGRRALVQRARRAPAGRAREVADAPAPGRAAGRERRPRLRPGLGGRRGGPSEPDLPGPARSRERPALLAPEGDRREAGPRRSLRRRRRGHQSVLRGLPRVAPARAPRARAGQPPPPALASPGAEAGPLRLPLVAGAASPAPTVGGPREARPGSVRTAETGVQ